MQKELKIVLRENFENKTLMKDFLNEMYKHELVDILAEISEVVLTWEKKQMDLPENISLSKRWAKSHDTMRVVRSKITKIYTPFMKRLIEK